MEIQGYKGFDKDLKCIGKQYAENEIFEEPNAEMCECGIHFCEDPFDVLNYYPVIDGKLNFNEFAKVTALGDTKKDGDKSVTTKIKIGAMIGLKGLINAFVDFALNVEKTTNKQIGSSGDLAKIGSSGDRAKIGSSGDRAQIGSSGDRAQIGSSGDEAQIGSSGDEAKIGSSGDWAQIGSSEDWAKVGSSGDWAKIGSSGDWAQIGSSGNGAKIGSSGNRAQIGSSGDGAKIGSFGDWAKIGSSGDGAQIGSSGNECVICCAGHGCAVSAKKGSWITLAEWKQDDHGNWHPKCVKTRKVDGKKIKEGVPYMLIDGKFVEQE